MGKEETKEIKDVKEKLLHLKNREGKTLTLKLGQSHSGEENAMIACVRDEYGSTYFKRDFYHPDYLRKEAASGHITFLTAKEEHGSIVGMLILKEFYPEESMCEIASQIFKKEYRGCGLAMPFFEYAMSILKSRSYTAAYCLPVLLHDITQRLLYRLGLRATGFILNVFDLSAITHSYENGRNTKHSQGIQVMGVGKQAAGILYIPKEHRGFTAGIYDRLGVNYKICTADTTKGLPTGGEMKYICDVEQSSMEIRILTVGEDCIRRLKLLLVSHPMKGKWTSSIFLNINDPSAIRMYRILKEMGYFLTGFKSLCSEREYMVLHHPGEVQIYMEDYVLSNEFDVVRTYVKSCYMEQYGEGRHDWKQRENSKKGSN